MTKTRCVSDNPNPTKEVPNHRRWAWDRLRRARRPRRDRSSQPDLNHLWPAKPATFPRPPTKAAQPPPLRSGGEAARPGGRRSSIFKKIGKKLQKSHP